MTAFSLDQMKMNQNFEYRTEQFDNEKITLFEYLLAKHDWTYNYADDMRDWRRGEAQKKEFLALKQELVEDGFEAETDELYKHYANRFAY